MHYFVYAISALSAASLLVIALRDNILKPWRYTLTASTLSRWYAVGALSILVELILLTFSVILVWGLQMAPRAKFRVVSGFAVRLVVVAAIIVRIMSLADHANAQHISSASKLPSLWTQLELHLSIVSATVPCLRMFLKSFNTGYYGMAIEQLDPTGTIMATRGNTSYQLSNMRSGGASSAGDKYKISNSMQSRIS
ncbi:hypothetical protein LTR37_001978 [Vermiconidia calcicola]|uniref:Uncharacterized protein n=1 Tax=Vermiconidia calcicola TaxID=1690605 RepID=A0ACC3NV70_9PEZI|nr:hypothetical protein LTR37_001978 [Vermiconidia calcicola]